MYPQSMFESKNKKNINLFHLKNNFCTGFKKSLHIAYAHLHNGSMFGLVFIRLNVPVNNFSVMLGRSHHFLGITSTFQGVNCLCSRTQYGGGRYQTPDLSLRSPRLYH